MSASVIFILDNIHCWTMSLILWSHIMWKQLILCNKTRFWFKDVLETLLEPQSFVDFKRTNQPGYIYIETTPWGSKRILPHSSVSLYLYSIIETLYHYITNITAGRWKEHKPSPTLVRFLLSEPEYQGILIYYLFVIYLISDADLKVICGEFSTTGTFCPLLQDN